MRRRAATPPDTHDTHDTHDTRDTRTSSVRRRDHVTARDIRRWGAALLAGATALGAGTALWAGTAGTAGAATTPGIGFSPVTTATPILPETAGQAVANEAFSLPNSFKVGEKVTIDLAPATASTITATCAPTTGNWVSFTGTPTVTVTGGATSETKPTISATTGTTLSAIGSCTGAHDQLTLVVTDTSAAGTTPWTVTVSGIAYSTMAKTPAGQVALRATAASGTATGAKALTVTPQPPSDADVVYPMASRATAPVTLQHSDASGQAVSDLSVAEPIPGTFKAGATLTVALSGATFDTAAPAKATATGGSAAVTGTKVTYSSGATSLSFKVKTASTGTPATYTVSGLEVDTSAVGRVVATITATNGTTTPAPMPVAANVLPLGAVVQTTRVEGATADDTARAEYLAAFPVTATTTGTGTRNAVLATDADYQDALSAAYLAKQLGTGVLLTPTSSLSQAALTTLAYEGVQHVYVVGGPLAISTTVTAALATTPSYKPGGTTPRGATLTVTRIYGTSADQTAQKVAQKFRATRIGSFSAPGAYGGTYNDTSGLNGTTKHSVPTTAMRTAVLARDSGYQDATAASALAYHTALPILLTPTTRLSTAAISAIENEQITQVIVMGGPLAITNTVVKQLESMGVDVFRVAGADATDTSQQLARFELAATKKKGRQWTASAGAVLARGNYYSDAVAGSDLAAKTESPIVLTEDQTTLGPYVTAFFTTVGKGTFTTMPATADFKIVVLGGGLAVTQGTVSQAENAITAGATS